MNSLTILVKNVKFSSVLEELKWIFGLTESNCTPDADGTINFYRNDIEFNFYQDHDFLDDMGIQFSKYPIVLGMNRIREGEGFSTYDPQVDTIARYLTEKIASKLGGDSILVSNLDTILAEYSTSKD